MALPVLVMTMDLVVRLTFDAAFMTGLSLAAIEGAREGAQVFAQPLALHDPDGEPGSEGIDGDDIADRIAMVVEQRLRMLRLAVRSADQMGRQPGLPGVRVIVWRGGEVASRGDGRIPWRPGQAGLRTDEIEVVIAVRMAGPVAEQGSLNTTTGRSWFFPDVVQAAARLPLE